MRQTPKPGELYRHFKNKLYQIIAVARHTETEEELVIYQALYGTYGIYARPLAMFMEKVDREKYPDAKQEYRFERAEILGAEEEEEVPSADQKPEKTAAKEEPAPVAKEEEESGGCSGLNPLLLSFVETRDLEVKLEILSAMEEKAGKEDLDALCESLDLPKGTGDRKQQVRLIRQYLEMQKKFDNKRLRS